MWNNFGIMGASPVALNDDDAAAIASATRQREQQQPLRLADLKKRYSWKDDAQAAQAIESLNMPKGKIKSATAGILGREVDRWQEWTVREIEEWEQRVLFVFPLALSKR
jgi:Na+-translocating ferredoxin:NAD+ oxidoreductase RnfC subunit